MTANSTPESHDAVVAEMRMHENVSPRKWVIKEWAGRLQSAHARELAEQQATIEALRKGIVVRDDDVIVPWHLYDEINRVGGEWKARADAAMGLLREVADEQIEPPQTGSLIERIDAFLAQMNVRRVLHPSED